MSTTTYEHRHFATADVAQATPRKPLWRRIFDALVEAQQRRADHEIARFVATHGGVLSDDMERQIMQHLSRRNRPAV
jgi:hypothetical protein